MAWPVMSGGLIGGEVGDQAGDVVGGAEAQVVAEEVGHGLAALVGLDGLRRSTGTVLVIAVAATGMTALAVTPARFISSAQVRTMPTMPALAAA